MVDELIGQFSPVSFSEWCREQFDRFTADPHAASDAGGFAQAEIVGYVQTLPDGDANRPLLVMAINAGEQINERSSRRRQFEFARKQLQAAIDKPPAKVKGLFTQGLFAFYDDAGAFRLSLVSGRAEGKRLVYSDFKRQSFFVSPDRKNKTFCARMASPFSTYPSLVEAFSVEALAKEFYNSLFAWYERAQTASTVWFPNDLVKDKKAGEVKSDQLIRLITRLMFVWFIRQKDLVPKQLFGPTDLTQILKNFDPFSSEQNQFYRAILQNLFFATLNCEIGERRFATETGDQDKEHLGIKMLFRYSKEFACSPEQVMALFKKAPFLNGGLFECLDRKRDDSPRSPVLYYDGFSRKQEKRARIPNNFFFDNQGLITLFARYDFTMDENAPNDADVALDPELLGKVFENLLGAYNPETRETARKQSGSFYTPREIVNYMVDESLVAHLRTQAHEVDEFAIRLLLGEENLPALSESVRRKLVEALYHCRILDPACGSGAFPMGLLLKMVHLLQRLDTNNTLWRAVVMVEVEEALKAAESLESAEKRDRRKRITDSFDQNINEPDYARKLYLIENCIFGVDIQSIAVQIAKLRAFITLVCDQKPDPANVAGNYGMLPLPNLETKFVAANSLIGLTADFADGLKSADGVSRLDDSVLEPLRAELADVRHRHFRARTAPEKNACRKRDRELRGKIKSRLVEIAGKPDAAKIALCQAKSESLQSQRKAVETEDWRDVVQSAPTQGDMFHPISTTVQTTLRMDVNKEQRDILDYEISRLTRAIQAEENRAKNKSAFQKEADRMAAWDPYDQNASSPFFDPEWMFGFKGGFDIVIGNPPYFVIKNDCDIKDAYLSAYPHMLHGRTNIYQLFFSHAHNVLRQAGTVAYIHPKTLFSDSYLSETRAFLQQSMTPIAMLNFVNRRDVFEAVLQAVAVTVFKKTCPHPETICHVGEIQSKRDLSGTSFISVPMSDLVTTNGNYLVCSNLDAYRLLSKVGNVKSLPLHFQTGKIEWNKYARYLGETKKTKNAVRIIYAENIQRYQLVPARLRTEQLYINACKEKVPLITGVALFVQRTTAVEQPFRIIPSLIDTSVFECPVTSENHTNTMDVDVPDVETAKYILAILASRLMDFYFRSFNSNTQVSSRELNQLPIIDVPADKRKQVVALVERVLAAKKADPAADTSKDEEHINALVYKLYNLTDEKIAIVEGREVGTKRTASVIKSAKASVTRQPRKSVMTDDPDLS